MLLQDQWTVPTLPDLALLFDAHTNFVKVVPAEFSQYLLKYTVKLPPGGPLAYEMDELFALGIPSKDAYTQMVQSCIAQHTVYTAADLALLARNEPVFTMDCQVDYVDIVPRFRRKYYVPRGARHDPPPHVVDRCADTLYASLSHASHPFLYASPARHVTPLRRYYQRPRTAIVHPLPEGCTTVSMDHGEAVYIADLTMYAFYNIIETGTFFQFRALAGYALCHIANILSGKLLLCPCTHL